MHILKNQIFNYTYSVHKYHKGVFLGQVAGMGRNVGTWDTQANSLRTAQRWAKMCRDDDSKFTYEVVRG